MADGDAGLQILDIGDPSRPVQVGHHDTAGPARSVQVAGNRAFVANGASGLLVLDVTDPAGAVEVGNAGSGDFAHRLQIAGNRAYLADGHAGLRILQLREGLVQSLHFELAGIAAADAAPIRLLASASSGLPVGFTVSSGPATVTNNSLTFDGVGRVLVRAEQSGDPQFLPAYLERPVRAVPSLPRIVPGSTALDADGRLIFRTEAVPGTQVSLLVSEDLVTWRAVGRITVPEEGISVTDPQPTGVLRFYRIEAGPR